jgi:hypothetical protein
MPTPTNKTRFAATGTQKRSTEFTRWIEAKEPGTGRTGPATVDAASATGTSGGGTNIRGEGRS